MADDATSNPLAAHWAQQIDDPHFAKVVLDCWRLYKSKGMDYTRGEWAQDRLSNFRRSAEFSKTTIQQAWGNLFAKGLHAIERYVQEGKLESEPLESRIHDAINYLILLMLIATEQGHIECPIDKARKEARQNVQHHPTKFPGFPPRF